MSSPSSSKPASSSHWNSFQSSQRQIQTTRSDSNTSNMEGGQNQALGSDSETEAPTSGKRKRKRIHFDIEQLQTVYHLPLKTAAERLGICEAALKRICRRNHVHKWPYRQLASVRRRIAELKDRYAVMVSGTEDRTDALPVVRDENSDHQASQHDAVSVTPAQFHDKLRRLENERDQIILSAHQHNLLGDTFQPAQLTTADTLMPHLHDRQSNLPLLDLDQFDRDFPLLFLANVCESVRAFN